MKLKALILDDEIANLEHLSYWIEKYCSQHIEVVASATTIAGALEELDNLQTDLLLLDVELANGITSFELLDQIPDWEGKIIFITAHKEYAIEAIKSRAYDYLLKPLSIKELMSSIESVYHSFEQHYPTNQNLEKLTHSNDEFISINHLNEIELIRIKDIMYITSSGNYTEFYLEDGTSTVSSKIIKIYEAMLGDKNFIRVHNSHIIKLDYLSKVDKENGLICIMKDGKNIPVSRRKKDILLNLLNIP